MKLSDDEKMKLEPRLWEITDACYDGVELPSRLFFRQCVASGDVFVGGTSPVSYALVTPGWGDERCPLIRSIATLPAHRGLGEAERLLWELADFYRIQGAQQIVLHCKTDNPAQTLYFAMGYRVTAILRGYYKPEGNGLRVVNTESNEIVIRTIMQSSRRVKPGTRKVAPGRRPSRAAGSPGPPFTGD